MPNEAAHLSIELLQQNRLGAAIGLVNALFPDEGEKPSESLRAIFEPHLHPLDWAHGICDRICWVASPVGSDDESEIVGVVGLYRVVSDPDALYLGWFGVRGAARGHGVGGRLLTHAITEAKRAGATYLRLDTTDEPFMAAANRLYEKHGLVVFRRDERSSESTWPTVWRELLLAG